MTSTETYTQMGQDPELARKGSDLETAIYTPNDGSVVFYPLEGQPYEKQLDDYENFSKTELDAVIRDLRRYPKWLGEKNRACQIKCGHVPTLKGN